MIIPAAVHDALTEILSRTDEHMSPQDRDGLLARADNALPRLEDSTAIEYPAQRLSELGAEVEAHHGSAARPAFAAALIAHLALVFAPRLRDLGLPESVLELYPTSYERLVSFLREGDLSSYWGTDDNFLKDLRFVAGFAVPCGVQDIDLYASVPRRSGLKAIVTQRDLRTGWRVIRIGGRPYLRMHTDQRYLEDFNEAGWERCYRRIADLMLSRRKVKGIVGTTWWFDPKIAEISPRLAYLQQTPMAHGATLIRNGPGAIHTQRATATSPTRRALVEKGEYVPAAYSIIWPREELLKYARIS